MLLRKIAILFILFSTVQSEVRKFSVFPKVRGFHENEINELCRNHILQWKENLKNYTLWAHKMLDSSSRSTFGVLRGKSFEFGDYEECLGVLAPYKTQYCLVTISMNASHIDPDDQSTTIFEKLQPPDSYVLQRSDSVNMGICLPASCQAEKLQLQELKFLFKNKIVDFVLTANEALCSRKSNGQALGSSKLAMCVFTGFLIFLVLLGTAFKVFMQSKTLNGPGRFLQSLSIQNTWSRLFQVYECKETRILDGVKSLFILTIVFAHLIQAFAFVVPWINEETAKMSLHSRLGLLFEKIDLNMDTFFTMSGLLLSFKILQFATVKEINPFRLILLRYIRLIPLHGYVSFLFAVLDYFKSGPLWNILPANPVIKNCQNNWIWNFLFVNNIAINFIEACNPVTWFVCSEFQLCIVGIFLILLIRRYSKLGHIVASLFFVCSIVVPFGVIYIYNIQPILGVNLNENHYNYVQLYYFKSYTHAGCYFIGLYGGLMYQKLISKQANISKNISYLVLGGSAFCMTVSFGYLYVFYSGKNNIIEMALYAALHRPLWTLGMLAIFVVTSFGPATSKLKRFLSLPLWVPFSKLTYAIFLIHMPLIYTMAGTVKAVKRFSIYYVVVSAVGIIITTLFASLLLYIFIEAPITSILKVPMEFTNNDNFLKGKRKKTDE